MATVEGASLLSKIVATGTYGLSFVPLQIVVHSAARVTFLTFSTFWLKAFSACLSPSS